MEPAERYLLRYDELRQAVNNLKLSLSIDNALLQDPVVQDSVESGQIQKFEFCTELAWKTSKQFLYHFHGIDLNSPKLVIKELYVQKIIDQQTYESLYQMIEDRNLLSHIYKKNVFDVIHKKLPGYLTVLEELVGRIAS